MANIDDDLIGLFFCQIIQIQKYMNISKIWGVWATGIRISGGCPAHNCIEAVPHIIMGMDGQSLSQPVD